MRKSLLVMAIAIAWLASCADPLALPLNDVQTPAGPVDQAELDADFADVLAALGKPEAAITMAAFDAKYGTSLSADFAEQLAQSRFGGDSNYPPLTTMPFAVDGAVYLSGGSDDLAGSVIGWVAPKSLPGGFYHGAILDQAKFDPNNLDAPALQSAIAKGAGYESANDWMAKVNAAVLNPNFAVNAARLNQAQATVDYYCALPAGQQAYGFFKNYVNIFNVVTKQDRYWWYCTKVVWEVYQHYGLDIDSNDHRVDFSSSGLYSLVSAYYKTLYFWSPSRARAAIDSYIAEARGKIVLAEEILLSPHFTKVFEAIRK